MKKSLFDKIIVAIDIGTTKISALIARQLASDQLEILALGKMPSYGLEKGVVIDMADAVNSIKNAIHEAEIMAGRTIESAYVGVSGAHIKSQRSRGMIPLKHGEVRQSDIAQVLASARAISIPQGEQILHALPRFFTIDGQQRVREPLGLCGIRLEVDVHIITGSITLVNNLIKCCNLAGINVEDIVLEQLASAYAVVSPDERYLGVTLIDIGGGTSDVALYHKGSILHTHVVPVAGTNFTHDLAVGLRTTRTEAERVKLLHGTVLKHYSEESFEIFSADGVAKKMVKQAELAAILRPRAQELFQLIAENICNEQLHMPIPENLVITGGGALLAGIDQLASEILGVPARIGVPCVKHAFSSIVSHPSHATAYGLLLYALQKNNTANVAFSGPKVMQIFLRMRSWVTDFF